MRDLDPIFLQWFSGTPSASGRPLVRQLHGQSNVAMAEIKDCHRDKSLLQLLIGYGRISIPKNIADL